MCFINEIIIFAWDCYCMFKVSVICTLIHVICSFAHPIFLSSFIHFMCHFNVAFKLFYTFLFEPLLIFICTSPVLLKNEMGWFCLYLTIVYSGEKRCPCATLTLQTSHNGTKIVCPNQAWRDRRGNKSFLFTLKPIHGDQGTTWKVPSPQTHLKPDWETIKDPQTILDYSMQLF